MDLRILMLIMMMDVINKGSAIMCYECNSSTEQQCLDSALPDALRRNCSQHERGLHYTLCRKIVQHIDHEVNGRLPDSRVIRTCGWDDSKYKDKCYHRYGYGGRQEVCSCTTDFCNGAVVLPILRGLLLPSMLLTVAL